MSIFKKFDDSDLFRSLNHRGKDLSPTSFSGKRAFMVTDLPTSLELQSRIGPALTSVDGMSADEIASSVFYVYFRCDSDALPVLERITDCGGTYVPHIDFSKTHYRFINRLAYNAMHKTWEKASRISHLDYPGVHENVCEALELTANIEGDYVEVGVFLGGSALTALNYLQEVNAVNPLFPAKKAWLLDTFDGFSYDEAKDSPDAIWFDTHKLFGRDETISYVRETLSSCTIPFELIVANICADPLPSAIKKISVANIDVDMFDPTLDALNKVADLVVPGGIIIVEDPAATPSLYGAYLAMNKFLESDKGKGFYKIFKNTQYFLIKLVK